MYSIATIVYGVKWNKELENLYVECENAECDGKPIDWYHESDLPEFFGFTQEYHGNSYETVAWFGIELGGFDDCSDFLLSEISGLKPTEEQVKELQERIDNLPEQVRELLGPVDIHVIWSTS